MATDHPSDTFFSKKSVRDTIGYSLSRKTQRNAHIYPAKPGVRVGYSIQDRTAPALPL
jgi:hypothetical protein